MDRAVVLHVTGRILVALALVMLVPAGLAVGQGGLAAPDAQALMVSALVTLCFGWGLRRFFRWPPGSLGTGEACAASVLGFVLGAAFSALPFVLAGAIRSPLDALFEALSGLTTSGATVLADPRVLPESLLLWRALTQGFGGLHFLAVSVAVLPALGAGGQLVSNEFREALPAEGRVVPRLAWVTGALASLLVLVTAAEALAFWLAGLPPLEAACTALSTCMTGGFAVAPDSLASAPPPVQWLAAGFLLLGGANVAVLLVAQRGRLSAPLRDTEVRVYLLLAAAGAVAAFVLLPGDAAPLERARRAAFASASAASTGGLSLEEHAAWPQLLRVLLLGLLAVGACSGSTGGGLKVVRLVVLAKAAVREVGRVVRPAAVLVPRVSGRPLGAGLVQRAGALLVLHLAALGAATLLLCLYGLDLQPAWMTAVTSLANGGGGPLVPGSDLPWTALPAAPQLVVMACMLLGRVEIVVLLVALAPARRRRATAPAAGSA